MAVTDPGHGFFFDRVPRALQSIDVREDLAWVVIIGECIDHGNGAELQSVRPWHGRKHES